MDRFLHLAWHPAAPVADLEDLPAEPPREDRRDGFLYCDTFGLRVVALFLVLGDSGLQLNQPTSIRTAASNFE